MEHFILFQYYLFQETIPIFKIRLMKWFTILSFLTGCISLLPVLGLISPLYKICPYDDHFMNNNLCYLGGMINIILLYTGIILIHLICLTILPNSHSTQTVLIGDFIIPYYSIYLVIIILLPILLIIVPLLIFKVNHIGFYIISIFIEFDMIYMLVMFIIFIFKCSKDLTICNSNNIVEDVEEDIFKDDIALNDMTDDVNIENISIIFKDETVDNIDPTNDNIDSINNVMMNI